MDKSDAKTETYKNELIAAVFILFLMVSLWLVSWWWVDNYVKSSDEKQIPTEAARGTFGDKFGAINSLFSGLAFAGIIFTIMLQRKELELQRRELEETRDVFITQNTMLSQEKSENTFFQLLNLFNTIVNNIDLRSKQSKNEVISTGRDCFETFYNKFKLYLNQSNKEKANSFSADWTLEEALTAYTVLYNNNESDLSHYFRTLYHIIKFVENSNLENKNQYTAIVRAQLSSYEQALLFYNCLHSNGNEKFKPLIENYALFKNLNTSLILRENHLNEYSKNAYGQT